MAVIKAAGQQQGFVEELANLGNQSERTPGAGMTAGASGYCDQAINPCLCGFLRVAAGGDVMEYQATVAVHGVHHLLHGAEAGDDDGHALFYADGQVILQARVAVVNDQIDRVRRRITLQACFNLLQPGAKAAAVTLIEGWKAADNAAVAAGQYQLRIGD